jgi:hypothetical protein
VFDSLTLIVAAHALEGLGAAVDTGLVGAGGGALVARIVVHRRERAGGEQPARWVRRVEFAWMEAGVGTALAIKLILE